MAIPSKQIGWSNESNLLWSILKELAKLNGTSASALASKITNEQGVPSFYADVFANIPAPGTVGRMFIATDTGAFYRDTGTEWELVGGTPQSSKLFSYYNLY